MNKKQTILFLSGTGLVTLALSILLYLFTHGKVDLQFSNFLAKTNIACEQKLINWKGVDAKAVCAQFADSFPFDGDAVQIEATDVSSPTMHYDDHTVIRLYDSANAITRDSYCYFIFKKYLGDGSIDPKTFGEVVSGFSILAKEIPTYRAWLKSNLGASCDQRVKSAIGVSSSDLTFLEGKSLVALYPLGAFQPGMTIDALKMEVAITLNHERIHLLENYCQGFESYQDDYYAQANPQEIAQMAEKFPSYDWSDPVVAAKEFMAFTFESNPTEIENTLNCSAQ